VTVAQPESKLSRKIQQALRDEWGLELFVFKVWGSEFQLVGLPDLVGCVRGYFFGLEVKQPSQRRNSSARQKYVLGLIEVAGGIAGVVCSTTEAVDLIRRSIQGSRSRPPAS
jgi:hypothetical protein